MVDEAARKGPLSGIRVVEVGVWHAGPGGSAILGDLGAEVIKVETLDGDPERRNGGFGPLEKLKFNKPDWSVAFEISGRNKKSIALDITVPEGREIFDSLVESADIFLTNLRTTTKPKLGIDFASLSKINPRLVHVNVTGYGPEGPYADAGGFDPLGQAVSGMMFLAGGAEPRLLQVIILDQLTAIAASFAAIAALAARDREGVGQEVHASLYGSAVWLLHANFLTTSLLGEPASVFWERKENPPLRNTYQCSDGWIMLTNHPDMKYWPPLCQTMGREDLLVDPRFDTPEKRDENRAELVGVLDEIFLTRSRQQWLDDLRDNGVLAAPINTFKDVLDDEQAWVNGYLDRLHIPDIGEVVVPGFPMRFTGHQVGTRTAAPGLGEHTDEVLGELGIDSDRVGELRRKGVVG